MGTMRKPVRPVSAWYAAGYIAGTAAGLAIRTVWLVFEKTSSAGRSRRR